LRQARQDPANAPVITRNSKSKRPNSEAVGWATSVSHRDLPVPQPLIREANILGISRLLRPTSPGSAERSERFRLAGALRGSWFRQSVRLLEVPENRKADLAPEAGQNEENRAKCRASLLRCSYDGSRRRFPTPRSHRAHTVVDCGGSLAESETRMNRESTTCTQLD
jgi:hypothetical protein